MPLKMINTEEQVTEVITEVAEQIGSVSDVKAKQREAILAFLSGKDTFCFYSHFCFCFYVSDDESGSVWLMLISLRISSVIFITCSVKLFTLSFQCSSGKRSKTNTVKLVNLLSPFRKRAVAFNIS